MRHPVHDILIRWLETEQYAFDRASQEYWPPACHAQDGKDHGGDFSDSPRSNETAARDPG
jgi:hypothetical protein